MVGLVGEQKQEQPGKRCHPSSPPSLASVGTSCMDYYKNHLEFIEVNINEKMPPNLPLGHPLASRGTSCMDEIWIVTQIIWNLL